MTQFSLGVCRDPDRTRSQILQAATREMVEHGFGGARIDRIAHKSGFNKRMIYHYFGDKEALYAAVLDEVLGKMRIAERDFKYDDLSPQDGIDTLVRFVWRYFVDNPEIISLLNTENLQRAKFLNASQNGRVMNHYLVRRLRTLLRRGSDEGAFVGGLDPLTVFITILSLSFFYLSNRFTLSAIFGREITNDEYLRSWEAHVVHVVRQSISV